MALRLAAEYPGKLFFYRFQDERITVKPHFFLHGYAGDPDEDERHRILTPVHFAHGALEPSDWETFAQGRIPRCPDTRFVLQCGTPVRVTFSRECPPEYRGRTMALPAGAYPEAFLPTGELLILGEHRIYVVEPATLKIVAKLPHKGDVADVVGNYILTTAGSSFYCYGTDTSVTARRKKGPHRNGAGLASLYAFCCAERRHFVFPAAVHGKTLHRKAFEEPRRRPVFSHTVRAGAPSRKKIPRPARDCRGERHGISGGETAQSGIPAKNRRGDSTGHCIF